MANLSSATAGLGDFQEAPRTDYAHVNPAEAYERGFKDIQFFMMLALPLVATSPLPLFYVICWQIICHRDPADMGRLLRFALGLPRGHAKTTFIKVLIAWLICYNKASFILIVCAAEDLAQSVLSDIDAIMSSPNIEAIYGKWADNLSSDNMKEKICMFQGRLVILKAKGAQSTVRGINEGNERPDVIFCDDVQTKENDKSETLRNDLLQWLTGTLFKTLAPDGDRLIIYAGNMYSEECILYRFKMNKHWISLVTGAILEDGTPLWPELYSLETLLESYEHDESLGQGDSWFAEVMNDPTSLTTTLLPNGLPPCPYPANGTDYMGAFITIDPAGFRTTSDDNVIVGTKCYGYKNSIARIQAGNFTPQEVIVNALAMASEIGATVIGVEAVAYQQSLCFWMEFFIKEMNIQGITVVELKPHGKAKEVRIRQLIVDLYEENTYIEDGNGRTLFTWQAYAYRLGKKNNKDDILDACAYTLDMRAEYSHLIGLNSRKLNKLPRVVANNTPF